MDINTNEFLDINGTKQFVAVRAAKPDLPLLLYVHGGPGDAALPLVLKYNQQLAEGYTLIIWEQRGAGKSYYPFKDDEVLTLNTFVEDLHQLVNIMLKRFNQKQLTLVGHSWGSVIGLKFAIKYPECIKTYVGCGQVVDMHKGLKHAWEYAMQHANEKCRKKLANIDISYQGEHWLEDLLFVTKLVVKHKGSYYGYRSYNKMVIDFIFSKDYRISDLINREKGSLQSIQRLWPELMSVSFLDIHSFAFPIVLIEGRYDHHVDSMLAEAFYQKLTSEKKLYLFEKSCHFPQWSESERFNKILLELLDEEETLVYPDETCNNVDK